MGTSPAVPYSRDYKKKYEYFRSKLKKHAITQPGTRFDIKVWHFFIVLDFINLDISTLFFRSSEVIFSKILIKGYHRSAGEISIKFELDFGSSLSEKKVLIMVVSLER